MDVLYILYVVVDYKNYFDVIITNVFCQTGKINK